MAGSSFKDVDHGYEHFVREYRKAAKGPHAAVGIQSDEEDHEEGTPMVMVAAVHEFGATVEDGFGQGITIEIPERSFIRSAFDENRRRLEVLTAKLVDQVNTGRLTVEKALALLGETHQKHIQRKITTLREPPLAPRTIAEKGSDNPLVDEGHLRRAIRYVVHASNGGGS